MSNHHSNPLIRWHGVLITVGAVVALQIGASAGWHLSQPAPLYLAAVVYAAAQGGLVAGLTSAVLALLYAAYSLSMPGQAFHYTTDNASSLFALVVATLLIVSIVGALRGRLTKANEEIERIATTDSVTQVQNRSTVRDILEREIARARRTFRPLSVLFVDIDEFKSYNDAYGSMAGDEVLQMVAMRLKQSVRTIDTVGRFGDEEFVIVLPDTGQDGASILAERLRKSMEKASWPKRAITASVGAATFIAENLKANAPYDSTDLLSAAGKALYHSRANGQNRVTHVAALADVASVEV